MSDSGQLDRTIWLKPGDPSIVQIIDQRALPHRVVIKDLRSYRDGVAAIRDMLVRGAPLIGATAAWSLYLAALESQASGETEKVIAEAAAELSGTRPTAVNLRWAIDRDTLFLCDIHRRRRGPPLDRCEPARVAVGQNIDRLAPFPGRRLPDRAQSVIANAAADFDVFFTD